MTVPDKEDESYRRQSAENMSVKIDLHKSIRFANSTTEIEKNNLILSGEDTDDDIDDSKGFESNFSQDESAPSSPSSLYTPSASNNEHKVFLKPSKASRRAFLKSGQSNVLLNNSGRNNHHYFQDLMTTLVECRWRYTWLVLILSFFLSWIAFAVLWYVVAVAHGDLAWQNPPPDRVPCIRNLNDATGCFLFSMESQTTVGYGVLHPSVECPEAIFLLCMQSIFGLLIQTIAVGVVFAKLARPRQRSAAILFSKAAVVSLRQGYLCLQLVPWHGKSLLLLVLLQALTLAYTQVRVVDLRRPLIGAKASMVMLGSARTRTAEGLRVPLKQTRLFVSIDDVGDEPLLAWPLIVYHRIDSASPLYKVSAAVLARADLEFVVTLEGSSESTGQPTRGRTSYLASEILWGYQFASVLRISRERQRWVADVKSLDDLEPTTNTPLVSAKHFDMLKQQERALVSHSYLAQSPVETHRHSLS